MAGPDGQVAPRECFCVCLFALAFNQSCRKPPVDGLAGFCLGDPPGFRHLFGTMVMLMDGMPPPVPLSPWPPGVGVAGVAFVAQRRQTPCESFNTFDGQYLLPLLLTMLSNKN